jgi:hypothetical protein
MKIPRVKTPPAKTSVKPLARGSILLAAAGLTACVHLSSDPIIIKHEITIGVDKALEDFFAFQEKAGTAATTTATTAPTTQTAQAGDTQ